MEYNKTGDWGTDQMPSILINDEKIKATEKIDVFNSLFLSVTENLSLHQVSKDDPVYFLKDAFPCKFCGIKIFPTS
jgi:hypothetical protein